ncbi:MAG: helix-turn-helix domain-containing protein [Verrucomicrobiota bacterium]
MTSSLAILTQIAAALRFEPHDIRGDLDQTGRYQIELPPEFPFVIKLFHYTSRRHTRGLTWHERLELFLPLDGPARFLMGDREVRLEAGDLLVVDNLKLHSVVNFPGFDTRVIVISFRPEFVYSLGSPSHDYAFLLPFYSKVEAQPHILRGSDGLAAPVYSAMARLLECYFHESNWSYYAAGCKAHFLQVLYYLARRFHASEVLKAEFLRQQQKSQRLRKLLDYLSEHYAERMTVAAAAKLANMSQAVFMKLFKQVAGMTFVAYLTRVRLTQALPLLRETDLSIAEISGRVGFSEQSYFDRRFKKQYGCTPLGYRKQPGSA